MSEARLNGGVVSIAEHRLKIVRFLRDVIRDLEHINEGESARKVLRVVERCLAGDDWPTELHHAEVVLLGDIVHALIKMARQMAGPRAFRAVNGVEGELNQLVLRYAKQPAWVEG